MKLSVITINYNNREGLRRTIDSVVGQTFRDFEWIIIDGGSTDGSRQLIEQIRDPRLAFWCSEPDKGIYNAMNKGVSHAIGEFVLFLNSGDFLHGSSVLDTVNAMGLDADIVSGQVVRTDTNQLLRKYDSNLFMQIFYDTLSHQGSFIRRSLFNNIKYDETLKIVSDWKFWVEAIIYGNVSVKVIATVVADQDMGGISTTKPLLAEKERHEVLNLLIPKQFQNLANEYRELKESIICRRVMYLKHHHPRLYSLTRQLLSVMLLIVGVNNEKLLRE